MKRRARRCLGVDIGSTSLKIAELSQDRTGVIIHRLVEAPLDVGPDASAEERWTAIVQTLRDLLREYKIATRQAVFALPGQAVFIRRVRLPLTSEERLHRIIRFEARQQIPFPLEQTLLQYQISPTEVEDEVEVLLVAIKREIVDQYMGMVRRLGLRPIRLSVSSFALFNFHMFDRGVEPEEFSPEEPVRRTAEEEAAEQAAEAEAEAKKAARGKGLLAGLKNALSRKAAKAAEAAEQEAAEAQAETAVAEPFGAPAYEEVKAYINIGASTMDLAIGRTGPSRLIGFARSIPLAGNHLTRAIMERCGCETFTEAEKIKREQTQVLLGGAPPAADRYKEEACRAIMPTIDRMVAEIRRSLDFYISQPDGVAVDRLVISGGQSALPNLPAYLEERLGVPVEIAREVHNPRCRSNLPAETDVTNYLVAMGLALQGLGATCITIDFLPEHLKGWIEFKRKNVQLAIQLAIVGAMLFMASQVGDRMSFLWETQARNIELDVAQLGDLSTMFQEAQTKRQMLTGMAFVINRAAGKLEAYGEDRDLIFRTLAMIQSERPADVFLQGLEIGPNGKLVIDGLAEQVRSAASLAEALENREEIERATFTRTPAPMPVRTGVPGIQSRLYSFQVTAWLKNKHSKIEPTPPEVGSGARGARQWRVPRRRPPVRPAPGAPGRPAPGQRYGEEAS